MPSKSFKVVYKPTGETYEAKRYEDMTQEELAVNNYTGGWDDAIFVKFADGYRYQSDNILEILEDNRCEES